MVCVWVFAQADDEQVAHREVSLLFVVKISLTNDSNKRFHKWTFTIGKIEKKFHEANQLNDK